jgi:hypothetical protein
MNDQFTVSPMIMHERLDGEVVALDMSTGRYFSMSGPGADIWFLIVSGLEFSQWSAELAKAYSATENFIGIEEFVFKLEDAGLVTPASGQSASADWSGFPNDHQRQVWTSPELFSYDDLSDLILIDPIHDVADDGWPTRN